MGITLKISVPWPVNLDGQDRIKKALSLWEDKKSLLICMTEPSNDDFIKNFDTCILSRNSNNIGTIVPKCFILDIVQTAVEKFPQSDWYGFGNSDVVHHGNLLDCTSDEQALIFHRTEIEKWDDLTFSFGHKNIEIKIYEKIYNMRSEGISDKEISKQLNKDRIKPPDPHVEWNYSLIKHFFSAQGEVFFWGQDLFLFRRDIVDRVIKEYLSIHDPVLSSGGYDPRISRWLMENFKTKRILNKIFHKKHTSEWSVHDVDYLHNGGDIPLKEIYNFYNCKYYLNKRDVQDKPLFSKHIRKIIQNNIS